MKERVKITARNVLTACLERDNHRKTPERFAILDAACELDRQFSVEELNDTLNTSGRFRVSRATLYNTLRLFLDFKLLVQYRFKNKTRYELSLPGNNHSRVVCTACGKVIEMKSLKMDRLFSDLRVRGFRKESFELNVYGVCSACRAKNKHKEINIKTSNRTKNVQR